MKLKAVKRHILKTISYRILGTLTTFTIILISGGSIGLASTLGIGELLLKPLLYFLHERVWFTLVKMKE